MNLLVHLRFARPRSSGDRAPASGAGCAGSNPAGGANLASLGSFREACGFSCKPQELPPLDSCSNSPRLLVQTTGTTTARFVFQQPAASRTNHRNYHRSVRFPKARGFSCEPQELPPRRSSPAGNDGTIRRSCGPWCRTHRWGVLMRSSPNGC